MSEIEKPLKSQNMADVVQKWYADFVDLEQVLLFELILAANYMDIKPLLDLTCATVASMIKGKTVRVACCSHANIFSGLRCFTRALWIFGCRPHGFSFFLSV
jgi:hypothetical protein